ncbi:general substrate transporter [Ilyonectria sp. MPI-CAGE-AT-0026]|nr:general substrate transporter [Ilyonectria sp. MPI-CAGE-AT-0026]
MLGATTVRDTPVMSVQHSNKRQWRPYLFVVMLSIGLGSMSFGYSSGVIGPTIAQPSFVEYFDLATRSNATSLISCMNSLFFAGATIFILTVPFFADKWGRRAAVAVAALIIVISGAVLAGSVNVGQFIFFRFISGAGAYMMISAVTLWMTEIAPPAVRGVFVSLVGASLLFGYSASAWVGYGFYHLDSPHAWRPPFALQGLPALILLFLLYWLPESPRWLMLKGHYDEARNNLLKLHTPEEAEVEFSQIRLQTEIDKNLQDSYWAMFSNRNYRKRTLIGMGTFASIQTSAILVINNYGPMIYGTLGFDNKTQLMYAAAWLTLGWGGGCLALLVVDRIPRPQFIGYGLLGCQACLIIEAALVANFVGTSNTTALRAAVAILFIFVFIYEFALDSAQFVYLGELFPTHIRAKGVSLGCGTLALMNVIWLSVAPTAFNEIGWKFYLCFIIPGCLCAFGILYYFPDTLGLPLEEIDAIFTDKTTILGIPDGGSVKPHPAEVTDAKPVV